MAEPGPGATATSSVLALISSAVGAGVLSFPYAFRHLGWAAALVAVAGIAVAEGFTLYVVARFAEYTKQRSYAGLVHTMLGRGFSLLMCAVMILYPFGSCIAYLVITGDSFQPLLQHLAGGAAWYTSRAAIIAGVGCAGILPLCFRTRLAALKAVSSMCVWGLLVVVALVMLRSLEVIAGPGHSWAGVRAVNTDAPLQFLSALVIVIFGFHSHTNVVTIFDELEEQPTFFSSPSYTLGQAAAAAAADGQPAPAEGGLAAADGGGGGGGRGSNGSGGNGRRPRSAKLVGMVGVVSLGLLVTGVLYTVVGMAGFLAFPTDAESDITLNFAEGDLVMAVARAAIGLIMVAAYPINHHPARTGIHDLLLLASGRSFGGPGFVAAEALCFFLPTLAIALRCSDLGAILRLVGGTCGAVLIFLMPGALLVRYSLSKAAESQQRKEQHAEAAAAALESQLGEPLLGDAAAAATYRWWLSKHFWGGVLLLAVAAGLVLLTLFTSLHPKTIN